MVLTVVYFLCTKISRFLLSPCHRDRQESGSCERVRKCWFAPCLFFCVSVVEGVVSFSKSSGWSCVVLSFKRTIRSYVGI